MTLHNQREHRKHDDIDEIPMRWRWPPISKVMYWIAKRVATDVHRLPSVIIMRPSAEIALIGDWHASLECQYHLGAGTNILTDGEIILRPVNMISTCSRQLPHYIEIWQIILISINIILPSINRLCLCQNMIDIILMFVNIMSIQFRHCEIAVY